jgi:hypothetical protein
VQSNEFLREASDFHNPVRFVDALSTLVIILGFKIQTLKTERPSFDIKVFLKYICTVI